MPKAAIRHEFVEFIPERLESGVLYVSMAYATAAHKCICGCGNEVVTPLSPTDWCLSFDGETVSLDPSIGNWSFKCQSHYWIRRNKVRWAAKWDQSRIELGRQFAQESKGRFYGGTGSDEEGGDDVSPPSVDLPENRRWWERLTGWRRLR